MSGWSGGSVRLDIGGAILLLKNLKFITLSVSFPICEAELLREM